jgi:hypothetical protein
MIKRTQMEPTHGEVLGFHTAECLLVILKVDAKISERQLEMSGLRMWSGYRDKVPWIAVRNMRGGQKIVSCPGENEWLIMGKEPF